MNLLLFVDGKGEAYPVLEKLAELGEPPTAESGRLGQLRFAVRQSYQRLRERFDHAERLCANLRHAPDLTIVHGQSVSPRQAEKKLKIFLEVRYSKHGRWLLVDSLLAGAGSILTPIPGPNVFFFYPAARAWAHYLARQGARKAQGVHLQFKQDSRIDLVQQSLDQVEAVSKVLQELERDYNIGDLANQLKSLKA